MAVIDFDYSEAYRCAARIKQEAAVFEQERVKLSGIMDNVAACWSGAGASEYLAYLDSLKKSLSERTARLYEIAEALTRSAAAAEETDREMLRAIAKSEVCPPPADSGAVQNASPPAAVQNAAPHNNSPSVRAAQLAKDIITRTAKRGQKR